MTALTLRAVFRLAYRQAEGLLGLSLRVPDHTTLSRRAATLDVPRPQRVGAGADSEPMHLLVDSAGLKLCGKGEWLLQKHGTATRRSWRMLHLGVDAVTSKSATSSRPVPIASTSIFIGCVRTIETAMSRYKCLTGPKLHSRSLPP